VWNASESGSDKGGRAWVFGLVDALDASLERRFVWRVELDLQHGEARVARRGHESAIHADLDIDVLAQQASSHPVAHQTQRSPCARRGGTDVRWRTHRSPGGLFMPQFDHRTTQFPNDGTLIAQARQKVLDVIEQGTMKWRFEETVAFRRVAVNLVRRARTGFHAGLKIV
jgi:hypothetical protein